jgi:hypothetical protein
MMAARAAAATARCLPLRSCATARATHAGHLTGAAGHAASTPALLLFKSEQLQARTCAIGNSADYEVRSTLVEES